MMEERQYLSILSNLTWGNRDNNLATFSLTHGKTNVTKIEEEWTKINKRNINQSFLTTLIQKTKIKTSSLVFCEIWNSKIVTMERGYEKQWSSGRRRDSYTKNITDDSFY